MFFAPILFFYAIIFFIVLFVWFFFVWIGVIRGVFETLGLSPHLAFIALLASLIGSYINIPVARVASRIPPPAQIVSTFGVRYPVPIRYASGETVVAINVGGAIVPVLISIYVLGHLPMVIPNAMIGIGIVALIVNRFARPVPGLGIATPMIVPPIVAALCGWLLGANHPDAVAYTSGVIGTLLGADVFNLNKISGLGAPVASIGGAGTFDGIFLTGIVAVLLA